MTKPVPFQAFFESERNRVYRYLLARVGGADVEDCFQETFLAALRAYPSLENGSHLRAWVLKIAERKVIDLHRRASRQPIPHERLPDSAAAHPSFDHEPKLWEAVRALPPKQQAAIVQRYVVDLSYAQIGEVTGTTEAAARQNVRAGLMKLREVWVQ